jgi:hypothetical protein
MTEQDRRAFLKQLAKGAVYTAPVVYSLAAPVELIGQGQSSMHKPPMTPGATSGTTQPGGDAPWDRPPPGSRDR